MIESVVFMKFTAIILIEIVKLNIFVHIKTKPGY